MDLKIENENMLGLILAYMYYTVLFWADYWQNVCLKGGIDKPDTSPNLGGLV